MKYLADYGVVGDGVADDTAAVQSALSDLVEGDILEITPGRFKIDGNLLLTTSWVVLTGRGEFLKDPLSGIKPMFIMDDFVNGVVWEYVRFDGSKSAFSDGNGVPFVLGHRNSHTKFHDIVARNGIDVAIKMRNTFDLEVSGSLLEDLGENGVECRWYEVDPRSGLPWEGPLPHAGLVNVHDNTFRRIGRLEDANSGLVDGCAFTADNASTVNDVRVISFRNNTVEDCLRGFYSENNPPKLPTRSVDASHNHFIGRVASGPPYVKQGIGLINVEGYVVEGNTYDNWGNHDPYESACDAIVLSGGSKHGVVAFNPTTERRTSGDRLDNGINVAQASDTLIFGNPIFGASEEPIRVDPLSSRIQVIANPGAKTDHSWGDTFEVEYYIETLPASQNGMPLKPSGWVTDPNTAATGKAALVAVSYRLSAPITAGTLVIAPYISGTEITGLRVNEGSFNGGQYAEQKVSTRDGQMISNMAGLAVRVTTNAAFACTGGAYVRLVFDRSRKV